MAIISRLDRVMADRKISVNTLSEKIDLTPVNISRIRTGKIKAIRFSTLEALCRELDCQPGDLFEFVPGDD
ncbi:MAG: helix-turn-helix transcriptional regulator [Eggerthellaceae bacterium]